jgi:hypothetical protein
MTRSLSLLPFLVLAACSGGGDKTDTADTDTSGESCGVEIEESIPSANAFDAYYRGDIEFILSDADPTATIDTDIPGTLAVLDDGERIVWQPSAPLQPNTEYTVTLNYCGGSAPLSFTTSSLGSPIEDGVDLVGKSYAINLASARITKPAGIGDVLGGYLTQSIIVGVTDVSDTSIQMVGALAKEGSNPPAQDFCDPSIPFPEADFTAAPFFSIGPEDTRIAVAGFDITIGQLVIEGTLASDASSFSGGVLSGTIDTRPLAPLLDDSGDPNAICELAANFGATCEACPDGSGTYCLTLVADQLVGEGISTPVVPMDGNDCTTAGDADDTLDCESWTASTVPDASEMECLAE